VNFFLDFFASLLFLTFEQQQHQQQQQQKNNNKNNNYDKFILAIDWTGCCF
jgi:membrane protein YqaA with SNARE-associated domain